MSVEYVYKQHVKTEEKRLQREKEKVAKTCKNSKPLGANWSTDIDRYEGREFDLHWLIKKQLICALAFNI